MCWELKSSKAWSISFLWNIRPIIDFDDILGHHIPSLHWPDVRPKQWSLGDFKQIVLIDSNATKMKPFHCITRAREIPLHVKLVLLQSFLWTAVIAPTLSFPLPQRGRWKAAFPQHYFPDLRTCMGASFVWLGAGSKLMGWEEMRSTLS